jgi:hypothetical protein
MDTDEFQKYLDNRYYKELKWYDKESLFNKSIHTRLQWSIIVLSSLTPVFIIIDYALNDNLYFTLISVISAIAVAIIASAMRTFKYYDNWISYRTTCETLKKEIYLYEAGIDEYAGSEDKESLFVKRVESLISRENTLWVTTFKKPDELNQEK